MTLRSAYPYLTKFERAKVLSERADQLQQGAPPLTEIAPADDALDIAMRELVAGVIVMKVRRVLPDGTVEDCDLNDLVVDPDGYVASCVKPIPRKK